jgi:Arc/MetJ-type ribon-helix-helix transcriptional regulator
MGQMRKITIELPDELISAVRAEAGTGITETVREALEMMRQRQLQNKARKMRGKIKFGIDLMKLREDED